jgi:hypothetical protein
VQEPVRHSPQVRTRKFPNERPPRQQHQAFCECGWVGAIRDNYQEAAQDAADHANAVAPRFVPGQTTPNSPPPDYVLQERNAERAGFVFDELVVALRGSTRTLANTLDQQPNPDWAALVTQAEEIVVGLKRKAGLV